MLINRSRSDAKMGRVMPKGVGCSQRFLKRELSNDVSSKRLFVASNRSKRNTSGACMVG